MLAEFYGFANKWLARETIPPLLDRASPLRTAHPRDPVGPQILASAAKQSRAFCCLADRDCFVASGSSQLAFRLRYLKAPRDIAVVKAAAERAGWEPRPSPRPERTGDTLTGRGMAYAQRSGEVVAIVAEVEIDRRSGKVWARKSTVAHDCGLIINPDGLKRCIEGNVVQGTSRALSEEVAFDRTKVTSTDWLSYPILDITEAPRRSTSCCSTAPSSLRPAPEKARSARSPRPSPTPSSTRPASACAALRLTPERLKPARDRSSLRRASISGQGLRRARLRHRIRHGGDAARLQGAVRAAAG